MAVKKEIKKKASKVKKESKTIYAGFFIRLAAALIDGTILMVVGALLKKVLPFLGQPVFNTLLGAFYYIYLWVNMNGQTVGKRAMKIKIIREDGKPLTYQDAVLRYLGYIVSTIPLLLGYFWIIWDSKKQGWHDKIAKTYVVGQ